MELTLVPIRSKPGQFATRHGERTVYHGKLPIYGAARALLKNELCRADMLLEFRHQNSPIVAFRGLAGDLAQWTVREGRTGIHRFPWAPMPEEARQKTRVSRFSGEAPDDDEAWEVSQ